MSRTRLLVVFGGASSEHEISLRSAASILGALDRDRYEAIALAVARDGAWSTAPLPDHPAASQLATIVRDGTPVCDLRALGADLVFPVLHGPNGEDGTIQGLLQSLGLPYVGSGVLASSLCMDKVAQKHLVAAAAPEVPMVSWVEVRDEDLASDTRLNATVATIVRTVGLPCFVKPVNLGSSVGVSRVQHPDQLAPALHDAARFDHRMIVEAGIDAREIEVAVLGNGGAETRISSPGEIGLPAGVWYDYDTKYINDVATLQIPADVPATTAHTIQEHALRSFRVTGCKGLARVDFLLCRTTGTAYLNELNTMPGFTSISMYPKLMAHDGLPYSELITRLCELGLDHHRAQRRLRITPG